MTLGTAVIAAFRPRIHWRLNRLRFCRQSSRQNRLSRLHSTAAKIDCTIECVAYTVDFVDSTGDRVNVDFVAIRVDGIDHIRDTVVGISLIENKR